MALYARSHEHAPEACHGNARPATALIAARAIGIVIGTPAGAPDKAIQSRPGIAIAPGGSIPIDGEAGERTLDVVSGSTIPRRRIPPVIPRLAVARGASSLS